MNDPSYLGLLHNAALLLATALICDIARLYRPRANWQSQMVLGVIIGCMGLIVMKTPWVLVPGVIFDTRSVLLSISGLFWGPMPTAIAILITAAYRILLGGTGVYTGVSVILITGLIGILWRRLRRGDLVQISWKELYVFGLVTTLTMLALMLTLPKETAQQTLSQLSLPVLLIYPFGSALLGKLLTNPLRREQVTNELLQSQERLRLTTDDLRKREEQYRILNEKLELLFDLMPVGLSVLNRERQIVKANSALADILRISPQGLANGDHLKRRYFRPDGSLMPAEEYASTRVFQGATSALNIETGVETEAGEMIWASVSAVASPLPDWSAVVIISDITKRKQAEDELALFKSIIEASQEAIAISDVNGQLIYINPAHARLFGRSLAEAQKINYRQLYPPGSIEVLNQEVSPALAQGMSWEGVLEAYDASGKLFPLWERADTVRGANGEMKFAFGIMHDNTENIQAREKMRTNQARLQQLLGEAEQARRILLSVIEDQKAAEEEVRTLNAELEQRVAQRTDQLAAANQELEAFSYSVSHDLRAPLRSLNGFTNILLNDYLTCLDDQGRIYLLRIQDAAQRMEQLINDLLNLSRITRAELTRQPVNLSAIAQEIARELKAQNPQRQLEFEIAANLLAEGDARLLRIMLENLLNNACKFTSQREAARIEFGALQPGESPTYFVRDNGVGFDMAYASKLFAPFQRLHSAKEFPGTGIGLVIVQRIITRHGGRIWPEAEANQGAVFYFTLGASAA